MDLFQNIITGFGIAAFGSFIAGTVGSISSCW
jgi:hypothetical protein